MEQDLVASFFSGKYEEARNIVGERLMGPGATARTKLYFSCSEAALVLTGRADPARLPYARTLYAEALKSYTVDEDLKLISPKILNLLQAK